MDIEETKKIIQNKIQADEAAREVRSKIKTYIHEKQNVREGFTETFKPLIETSEKVKETIDTQQNKLIKQLQENQLALTAGFEGNRLAITSGFDKMGIQPFQDFTAIEEPEKDEEEEEEEDEEDPQQLVSRLELLAGSIIAGNNGVKQEFSQIAHLLHQLKVINKKTLNDLLKIYILFNK